MFMNINKDSVKGFRWTEFMEHPRVDFQDPESNLFDVSVGKGVGFFSETVDGSFSHEQYCVSLMEKIFSLKNLLH